MPSHLVVAGDTYVSISTRYYGEPSGAALIQSANPGAGAVPSPGSQVVIPQRPPLVPPIAPAGPVIDPSLCELLINGQAFRYWSQITITRSLDAVDTCDFAGPVPDSASWRLAVRPLSFAPISVLVGGAPLFAGTMLTVSPSVDADGGSMVQVGAYSLPGVLGDCVVPASAYPLQTKGLGLEAIAALLAAPFGVAVETEGVIPPTPIDRVRIEPDRVVLDYLRELAQPRKVLLASSPTGGLLLRAPPVAGVPVVTLSEGERPLISASLSTDPQAVYSHLTCVRSRGRSSGAQHTVANPGLVGVLRPMVAQVDDVTLGELPGAAESLAGRMLAGAVTLTVMVATWRDPQGDLWAPGTTVSVWAPGAMVYEAADWIVREVRLARDEGGDTATLTLVLPGAFSGAFPVLLPWDVV